MPCFARQIDDGPELNRNWVYCKQPNTNNTQLRTLADLCVPRMNLHAQQHAVPRYVRKSGQPIAGKTPAQSLPPCAGRSASHGRTTVAFPDTPLLFRKR